MFSAFICWASSRATVPYPASCSNPQQCHPIRCHGPFAPRPHPSGRIGNIPLNRSATLRERFSWRRLPSVFSTRPRTTARWRDEVAEEVTPRVGQLIECRCDIHIQRSSNDRYGLVDILVILQMRLVFSHPVVVHLLYVPGAKRKPSVRFANPAP